MRSYNHRDRDEFTFKVFFAFYQNNLELFSCLSQLSSLELLFISPINMFFAISAKQGDTWWTWTKFQAKIEWFHKNADRKNTSANESYFEIARNRCFVNKASREQCAKIKTLRRKRVDLWVIVTMTRHGTHSFSFQPSINSLFWLSGNPLFPLNHNYILS